jgi:hypothetical protein
VREPGETYVSKRDGWLVGVIWTGAAVTVLALASTLSFARADPLALRILIGLGMLAAAGLGPWILYGTDYTLQREHLLVRSGPFRWRIRYAEISRVEPSASPRSSPACSLDRLLIQYGQRRILVSPLDCAAFVRRLGGLCPQLHIDGDRLLESGRT